MDWGTLDVQVTALGVRSDQGVQVARLELVGLLGERLEVADAVVAGADLEHVFERQRREGRVSPGAASAHYETVAVHFALSHEVERGVDAVVDIHDAPLSVESTPVLGSVAGAAAVVHVHNGDAATGPVLVRQAQRCRGAARRSAVADDQKRGLFPVRGLRSLDSEQGSRGRGPCYLRWSRTRLVCGVEI